MWKIAVGFIAFAAVALFILSRGGGDIDMSGEKHGTDTAPAHADVVTAPASGAAPASIAPASAASAAASSAKP